MTNTSQSRFYQASIRLEKRLKDREDEYTTYKPFPILVGTFNVNNRQPPSNTLLEDWLYSVTKSNDGKIITVPDIIAIGFQEIDTSSGAYIYDDKKKEDEWEFIVRKTIKTAFKCKDEDHKYQLLNRIRLMGMLKSNDRTIITCFPLLIHLGILLFVYIRAPLMSKCTSISRSSVPTGFMGIAGNKGGVGISFCFFETSICFINCHFASGDGQTQRRNDDYQTIESRMTFTDTPTYSLKDYIWYTPATTENSSTLNSSPSTRWFVL